MIGKLFEKPVRDFISAAQIAHLATVSGAGEPHNVPLCFSFVAGCFYFVVDEKPKRQTGTQIKRMRNIAANPRVALLIDHYEDDWKRLAYVLVHGIAKIVQEDSEYSKAVENLRQKYLQYRQMPLSPEQNPVVRIDPERVVVWGTLVAPKAQ